MKQVMNYNKENGLLNMIRRTDPMIVFRIRYRGIAKRRFPDTSFSPRLLREHQLFSSREIFWRNFYSKNQKVNASYVVICLSVYPLILLSVCSSC